MEISAKTLNILSLILLFIAYGILAFLGYWEIFIAMFCFRISDMLWNMSKAKEDEDDE